jgi:hypothetical protein
MPTGETLVPPVFTPLAMVQVWASLRLNGQNLICTVKQERKKMY